MKKLALLFAFAGFATFASAQTASAEPKMKTACTAAEKAACVSKTAACCAKMQGTASADAAATPTNNVVAKEKSCAKGKACCASKAEKAALKTEAQ
ncbi:MAG: hypothetical protein RL329_3867 [Bacteroidota bacterium]